MANKPVRVVLDTNILISFLITNSFSKIYPLLATNKVKLVFSNELLNEFLQVVARPKIKKYFPEKELIQLLENIQDYAEFIDIKTATNICRDSKDNFLLALCKDGKADYLITGDDDLLVLKKFRQTSIIKIAEFLKKH